MAGNRDKPPIEGRLRGLDSAKPPDQNKDDTPPTEQINKVRDAIASTTQETEKEQVEKRYRDLFGDIEVEAIVDKEHYERISAQIKERLSQDFSDTEDKRKNLTFNEFKQEIRSQYSGDAGILRFWEQQFQGMESHYQNELVKLRQELKNHEEELKKIPYKWRQDAKKRTEDEIKQLSTGNPWDVAHLRTYTNQAYSKKESYFDAPADSLYYITSFLKGELLDEQDLFKDIQETLKGKRILILGDDIGTVSEILRQYGAESYGVEIDKLKVAIAHSGILAKGQKPQTQVIEGNIGDIIKEEDSELSQQLKALGPFDMVYSYRVFNYGSGLEKELPFEQSVIAHSAWTFMEQADISKLNDLEDFQVLMKRKFDSLLNENGSQLHIGVNDELEYLFPTEYSERGEMYLTASVKEDSSGIGDHFVLIPKKGKK